ncbi:MAG: molybdenum cofactor guanylyltransferase [Candidatus Brocadiales bacterium]|nr:molybdenum cofactor guanylyltransferase [Candidatus Brocadiales bacterium]
MVDITAVVMAGGKSLRMGSDKALLKIGNLTAVEFQLQRLRPLFDEIILSTNAPEEFRHLDIPCLPDIIPDRGPLGGIYTALLRAKNPYIFAIACDMPFVSAALIDYLKEKCEGYDVTVPETDRGLEPLHAIYSRDCIPAIKKHLEADSKGRVIGFFPDVRVRVITKEEIAQIEGGPQAFLNFNTPKDYQIALELLRTGKA